MKSIVLSTLSAWIARGLAIVLNLVGIPLALQKLGSAQFALLLVILSISSWIGFANVGMGRVIANVVARQHRTIGRFATEIISSATLLSAGMNLALFAIGTTVFLVVVSIKSPTGLIVMNHHEFVVSIVGMFFALTLWFFLSLFEGIDAGHHQLHRMYIFQAASYALSILILFTAFSAYPSISFAAFLLNLGFLAGSILHALDVVRRNPQLFNFSLRWRRPIVRLVMLGSLDFVVISLGIGIIYQLPTGFLGLVGGADSIIELGIFMRLVQSYGSLVIAFTYPLSNIVASKLKARDSNSLIRTVRLSALIFMAGVTIAALGFYFVGTPVLSFWLRSTIHLDRIFLINGALLIVLTAIHFYLAALLIGIAAIKQTARIHLVEAVAFIPLSYMLFIHLQQGGALLATNLILTVGIAMMLPYVGRHPVLGRVFGLQYEQERSKV